MAASMLGRQILLHRTRNLFFSPHRNGYIVLLPEVPDHLPKKDIRSDSLVEISGLTTETCIGAIGKAASDYETTVREVEENLKGLEEPPENVFADVLDPLDKAGSSLDSCWALMKTLYLADQELMPAKCYMTIHDKARRARATKFNSLPIYEACKATSKEDMNDEQKRVVNKFVLEGRLNGLELQRPDKAHLNEIVHKIGIERAKFKGKTEAATKRFKYPIVDPNVVRDFPQHLLKAMALDSSQASRGPWAITLEPHIASEFMEYCPISSLRWNVWQASVNRGSGYAGDKDLETSTHVEEIRYLRRDQAKVLGFSSFSDMSMETKMAGSVKNVQKMISNLLLRAHASQERELASLHEFAKARGFEYTLELWDVPYWRRKQQKTLYVYDEEHLREYLPFPSVVAGLFQLCEELFGITIEEKEGVETWNADVKYYCISDTRSGEPIAGFYLDPYQRNNKLHTQQDAGWTVALSNKSSIANTQPKMSLIFNFQPPLYGKPSLLSFREVRLLFQKFGHALQHLLSNATYSEVSGLSNIEWDAVGVCSSFMTHWLYDKTTMKNIGAHYETGEPIPNDVLDNLGKVRHHMAGYDLCRELYLATLDLELHTTKDFWLDVVKRVWPEYIPFPLDKLDSHPCSFSAIFSEEWAAAYYCHLWARIVAADAFSAFLEGTAQERASIGNRFRSTYLELGGSCHPSNVFRRFRGRDPLPNALLNTMGLKQINK